MGHCCEQLEEGPEASAPGQSNPFGSSNVFLVPWVGDGLVNCLHHHCSLGNKWESITIRQVTALTLSFSEVLFCFGPGVMFSPGQPKWMFVQVLVGANSAGGHMW